MKYVKHFGLDLVPFRESGLADVYHIRGKRLVVKDGTEPEWPLPLSDEERALGLTGMREKYISAILPQIGDAGIPDAPPPNLRSFDRVTYSEWLRQRGASKGALELFRLGASGEVSALVRLRSLTWRTGATWWKIAGGNDRLPRAFAEKLASRIHYGSAVRRIRHDSVSVTVTYDRAGVATDLRADHAICTIPFPVLKTLEIEPLSDSKRRAISELHYPNATKIAIQTRTQFWRAEGLSGFAQADLPLPEIWNLSHGPGAQRGMLVGYVAGVHAKMPALATDQERLVWALPYCAQMFPGMEKEFESGKSYSWQEDPWAMGAFPHYGPTQVIDLFPAVRESQGRLHFAGDHASVWPGWMQGALESGNRAARVVNAAMS